MGALGDRMKLYEGVPQTHLTRRTPAIIRIDGKAFHSFTRGMEKPWDAGMEHAMTQTMLTCCREIEGTALGYWQSDEISLLLVDYKRFLTNPWLDKNVQKMTSIAASIATYAFGREQRAAEWPGAAIFDARVFVLPREEVNNYFLWRQLDATRNSILALAQKYFSHKQLHLKDSNEMQEMLWSTHKVNWSTDTPTHRKYGACAVRVVLDDRSEWRVDLETPQFSQQPDYTGRWTYPADEEGAERPEVAAI